MSTMTLQMPMSYVDVDREEMQYVDGGGWIAWTLGASSGLAYAVAGAIAGFVAGGTIGTVTLPVIGTVSMATVGALAGAAYGFLNGSQSGYEFGRKIERKLGWG